MEAHYGSQFEVLVKYGAIVQPREFDDFSFSSTYTEQIEPIAVWTHIVARQSTLVEKLAGKGTLTAKGPHIDSTFSTAGRTFISGDGECNMPDGEIFNCPVEEPVNGWMESFFPAIFRGAEVSGVHPSVAPHHNEDALD